MGLVLTLFKASVWSLYANQEAEEDDDDDEGEEEHRYPADRTGESQLSRSSDGSHEGDVTAVPHYSRA